MKVIMFIWLVFISYVVITNHHPADELRKGMKVLTNTEHTVKRMVGKFE